MTIQRVWNVGIPPGSELKPPNGKEPKYKISSSSIEENNSNSNSHNNNNNYNHTSQSNNTLSIISPFSTKNLSLQSDSHIITTFKSAKPFIPRYTLDVIDELENNRENYTPASGERLNYITLRNFPAICKSNINRLRQRVEHYKPGMLPSIAVCINGGLKSLFESNQVNSLLGLRSRFESAELHKLDSELQNLISKWFFQFEIDLPSSDDRINVPLPQVIFVPLSTLSDELGISNPALSVICIMITLSNQSEVVVEDREIMDRYVQAFWKRSSIRARTTKAILEEFGL